MAYNQNFEKPAPFNLLLKLIHYTWNKINLFQLRVKTVGSIIPENVSIIINNESYFLESDQPGYFTYTFQHVQKDITFHLTANDVISKILL